MLKTSLWLNEQLISAENLVSETKDFIIDPLRTPQKAYVELTSSRAASYTTYVQTLDKIKMAYAELREEYAIDSFNSSFESLSDIERGKVAQHLPEHISERTTKQ